MTLLKFPESFKKQLNNIKFIKINSTGKILSEIQSKNFIIDRNSCSLFFENIILENNNILKFPDQFRFFKSY